MLVIENLSKKLDAFELQIDALTVKTGEIFALLGPTGAGKSRFLEVLAGFAPVEAGRIEVDGREVTALAPEKRRIAVVFQEPQLFPHLNVARNICYASGEAALFRRITEILQLQPHLQKPPSVISGGERQLVAIARALMIKPRVLLLDEAFNAIDPNQRRRILHSFLAVQREFQITTLAVTHNFEEALYLADRLGIIMKGRMVQQGPPQEIFRHPAEPSVARFLGAENLYHGQFEREAGLESTAAAPFPAVFRTSGIFLHVLSEHEGPGYVLIHPHDITLSIEKPGPSSALNHLHGTVIRVLDKGPLFQISVDAGVRFEALITPQSRRELDLGRGSSVYLSFKAAAVKTYPSGRKKTHPSIGGSD